MFYILQIETFPLKKESLVVLHLREFDTESYSLSFMIFF